MNLGMLHWAAAAIALALCSGCSGCGKDDAPKPDGKGTAVQARRFLPNGAARDAGLASKLGGFRERLENEAKARPAVEPKAESVLEAVKKADVAIDRERQVIAGPQLAKFCMSAHAGVHVQLTVCEHENQARAEEHVAAVQKAGRPERKIARRGVTTLLVRRSPKDDGEDALVDKVLRAFEAMPAPDGG